MRQLTVLLWSLSPAAAIRFQDPPLVHTTSEISVNATATITTTVTIRQPEALQLSMSVSGLSVATLMQNHTVFVDFIDQTTHTIASLAGVPPENVAIDLQEGKSSTAKQARRSSLTILATITPPPGEDMSTVLESLDEAQDLAEQVTQTVQAVPGINDFVNGTLAVGTVVRTVVDGVQMVTTTTPRGVSSFGDPHSKNIYGDRFDIKRPGKHSFLVLPRGADQRQSNLHVEAEVTPRGGLCEGKLFITGLKLTGRWVRALGGDIDLHSATDMFNSPEVVGLKLGNSSNISLQEFAARIPKGKLRIYQYRPERPTKLNTHVNTLMLRFKVGPSTLRVGWSHEKLEDGFANWLWLTASGLGAAEGVGGLLGADDHSHALEPPEACQAAASTAGLGGWATVEA